MGKSTRDISFQKFIKSVKDVKLTDFTARNILAMKKSGIKVKSQGNFQEMRRHILNQYANTEVVKSFEDPNGQIWDCIPVNKQPALAGTNKAIAEPPDISSRVLKSEDAKKDKAKLAASFLSKKKKDKYGNQLFCPEGCVPIRRISLEEMVRYESLQNFFKKTPRRHNTLADQPVEAVKSLELHKYAHAAQEIPNTGGHSLLSINKPAVRGNEIFSLSQHWYTAGSGESLQTVEAGWQIYPGRYKTSEPCLFIYYTADNYHSTNGYNMETTAFCQLNNNWALGGPITGIADAHGNTLIELELTWALSDGKWWLFINGINKEDAVGYYPVEVFQGGPMSVNSTYIDYGGETVGTDAWPEMGNGKFPDTGDAAYQRNINYFDLQGNGNWASLRASEDFPNCYRIELAANNEWGTYFNYGGPGGNNC